MLCVCVCVLRINLGDEQTHAQCSCYRVVFFQLVFFFFVTTIYYSWWMVRMLQRQCLVHSLSLSYFNFCLPLTTGGRSKKVCNNLGPLYPSIVYAFIDIIIKIDFFLCDRSFWCLMPLPGHLRPSPTPNNTPPPLPSLQRIKNIINLENVVRSVSPAVLSSVLFDWKRWWIEKRFSCSSELYSI